MDDLDLPPATRERVRRWGNEDLRSDDSVDEIAALLRQAWPGTVVFFDGRELA